MNAHQLARALDELEAERVPAGLDLWPRLQARISAQPREVSRVRWLPATRLGWIALATMALLLVGTTVYATAPAIGRLLRLYEQETMHVDDPASLGQPLSLSQTIGDITVSLEWAYADANRVLVGYTVRSGDGRRFDPRSWTLAGEDGMPLESTMIYGVTGEAEDLGVSLPPGEGSYVGVWRYDAQDLAAGETLKLHLEMEVEELILPAGVREPAAGPVGPTPALLESLPPSEHVGPFAFDLSIPVAAGGQ